MKKLYLKPHTKENTMTYNLSLLAGSRRHDGPGDPNELGGSGVNDRTEDDEFDSEHSQGDGGNRSKAYQVWEY